MRLHLFAILSFSHFSYILTVVSAFNIPNCKSNEKHSAKAVFGRKNQIFFPDNLVAQSTICLLATNNPNDGENENTINGIPLLPPIGESSGKEPFRTMDLRGEHQSSKSEESKKVPIAFVGSKKFEMQYTCNVCDTRNSNRVSRLAYTKGVVIVVCKGCGAKHLIADNLGWSNYIGGFDTGETNIEEFLEANGRSDDVNRVNPTVWELENNLAIECDENGESCIADGENSFE